MRNKALIALATGLVGPALVAQNLSHEPPATPANHLTQFVTGLDIEGDMGGFADGTFGSDTYVSVTTTACNPGTVEGVWEANPDPDHPLINQMYCRLSNNRFEQISDYGYGKHSFGSTNSNGCGGGCTGAAFNRLGVNCSDTYGSTLNWNRGDLGPLTEWNAYTGEYQFTGSHLDTGYPQTPPDGSASNVIPNNSAQFRQRIPNSKIGTPGATYYCMIYYLHKWEPIANRENNMSNRQISLSVGSASGTGTELRGNILEDRYAPAGATVESACNEVGGVCYDGMFYVGVHVNDNGDGTWRYEYAVHNRDNHAGNVQFIVPCGPTATVTNIGSKDVDLHAEAGLNNDWTGTHNGNCIVWNPGPEGARPQGWNTIYNFWFDADVPPTNGSVEIMGDPSRLNPGANVSVVVTARVPNAPQSAAANENLGQGCGLSLSVSSIATPFAPINMSTTGGAPGASAAAHVTTFDSSFPLGPPVGPVGCSLLSPIVAIPFSLNGGGAGTAQLNLNGDRSFIGRNVFIQSAALLVGGPVVGVAELSNIMRVPVCP